MPEVMSRAGSKAEAGGDMLAEACFVNLFFFGSSPAGRIHAGHSKIVGCLGGA